MASRKSILPSAAIGVVVLLVLAFFFGPRLLIGWLEDRMAGLMLDYTLLAPALGTADAARPYRLATDTLTTPDEAGVALQRLLWEDGSATLLALPDSLPPVRVPELADENPTGIAPADWSDDLLALAAEGLTAQQLAYLEDVSSDSAVHVFARFARARDADILGTRYDFTRPPQAGPAILLQLMAVNVMPLEHAFSAWFAGAAVELHAGRPADAERLLREAINGGLHLIDDSGSPADVIIGSGYVRRALDGLATFYRLTGRSDEAARIEAGLDEVERRPTAPAPLPRDATDEQVIEAVPAIFARDDLPPAVKWAYLARAHGLEMTEACSDRDTPEQTAAPSWRARARAALADRPSHRAMFDWITSGEDCR